MKYFAVVAAVATAVILTAFCAGDARGEVATDREMKLVCQNWLTLMVQQKGGWAGDANPRIIGEQDLLGSDNTVLARCYSISPRGFVVVPVLKELPPVKAYSDESDLDASATGGLSQLLREVLEHRTGVFIKEYGSIEASQPAGGEGLFGTKHRQEWNSLALDTKQFEMEKAPGSPGAVTDVGPLLTSSWDQNAPYKNYCPAGDGGTCVVGCVATAAAQIMNYHKWPTTGVGSHSYYWGGDGSCGGSTSGGMLSADFSDTYDWPNMADDCGTCTPAEQAAVAELSYEVGVAFNMDYGVCGSGAFTAYALTVFPTYFRYDSSIDREDRDAHTQASWWNIIQTEINEGTPMLYRIYSHAIVCDGWRVYSSLNQYHMNYGWDDSHTAWYTIDGLYCPWAGCAVTEEFVIRNIIPLCNATVDFAADDQVGCAPLTVNFTDLSTGPIVSWLWDFGDGNTSALQNPSHDYLTPGDYTVSLTVTTSQCYVVETKTDYISVPTGAVCQVTPTTLDFGSVEMGDSLDMSFTIKNPGCTTLSGTVSEFCPAFSFVSGGGAYSLNEDDSVVVAIRFKPTNTVTQNCWIETGAALCADVFCTGVGTEPPPSCSVVPDTLDFGSMSVGSFAQLSFVITNTGYGLLQGTVSESHDYFTLLSTPTYMLAHGQSHTIIVLFVAGAPGPHECIIETGDALCADVYAVGVGTAAPACLVDPTALAFGSVTVGSSSDKSFIITNTGGGELGGTVSEPCSEYSIVSGGGPYTLAAAESLVVTIRYEPSAPGTHECTVETGDALCTDVFCTGEGGTPPVCVVEPDSLHFGTLTVNDSLDLAFYVTNTGGGILSGSVADTCSYFDVVSGGGPYALANGDTAHVTVRFKPVTDGTFECVIETGAGACVDVYCEGVGEPEGIGILSQVPGKLTLYQNFPNPFNPSTTIAFWLPERGRVSLRIYDVDGGLVRTLVDEELGEGIRQYPWDGRDSRGNAVSSGVYFYRLRAGTGVLTRKMVLLK